MRGARCSTISPSGRCLWPMMSQPSRRRRRRLALASSTDRAVMPRSSAGKLVPSELRSGGDPGSKRRRSAADRPIIRSAAAVRQSRHRDRVSRGRLLLHVEVDDAATVLMPIEARVLDPLRADDMAAVTAALQRLVEILNADAAARIRLSDKTSRLHPRHVVPKPAQPYEPEVPVKVWEWISPALASPDLVLEAQPPAQPHSGVSADRLSAPTRRVSATRRDFDIRASVMDARMPIRFISRKLTASPPG